MMEEVATMTVVMVVGMMEVDASVRMMGRDDNGGRGGGDGESGMRKASPPTTATMIAAVAR